MRKSAIIALWAIVFLAYPIPFPGEDLSSWAEEGTGTAMKREMVIPYDQAEKLLDDLERGKLDSERAAACEDAISRGVLLLEACKALKDAFGARVLEVTKERDEALALAKEAAETGKKIGKVPWYQKLWTAGKWFLFGGLLGFAASAGR